MPPTVGPWLLGLLLACVTPAQAQGQLQEQLDQALDRVMPAVVQIHAGGNLLGSGFLASDSLVVTNNHVIEGFEDRAIGLLLQDGRITTARVVHHEKNPDLAILRIDEPLIPAPRSLKFADMSRIRPGLLVLAIGHPGGLGYSVSQGILSAVGRPGEVSTEYFLQTDAAINGGSSGGPLVNLKGEVVGINTSKLLMAGGQTIDGISFALAGNIAERAVRDVQQFGKVVRPALGIDQLAEVTWLEAREFDVSAGSLRLGVVPGGLAHEAGLRDQDILTAIDGRPVNGLHGFWVQLHRYELGSTITLSITRQGTQMKLAVPLLPPPYASFSWSDVGMDLSPELRVLRVEPDSPFGIAGLGAGDTLLRVRMKPSKAWRDVHTLDELKQAVLQISLKGASLGLIVKRKGKQVELKEASFTPLRSEPCRSCD